MHPSILALLCSMLQAATVSSAPRMHYHIFGVDEACIVEGNFVQYYGDCVPLTRPNGCSAASWKKLKSWNSSGEIPECPPPPKYQSIKGWEKCLRKGIYSRNHEKFDCLDKDSYKPKDCKQSVYNKIKELKGKDAVSTCPYID